MEQKLNVEFLKKRAREAYKKKIKESRIFEDKSKLYLMK